MEHPNVKTWTIIYPAYLDSKHLKSQGRKIPKKIAVETPTLMEISEVLTFFKLNHCLENKAYPKDILERGRIRVKLFDDDHKQLNSEIANSNFYLENELLKRLAAFIPRLKSRMTSEETKSEPKKRNKNKKK